MHPEDTLLFLKMTVQLGGVFNILLVPEIDWAVTAT